MDQLIRHVALVSETSRITAAKLAIASAAIQKQILRDFGPLWNISATVDAFPTLEDVPIGYWPVLIQDDIHTEGAAGIHEDKDGQPLAAGPVQQLMDVDGQPRGSGNARRPVRQSADGR